MRVLIACEYSGVLRDAFIRRGHEAMSCDLMPTEKPGPHYVGSMFDIFPEQWDLVIAHPPCTHLAAAGAKHFAQKREDGRQQQGIDLFMAVVEACSKSARRWCIENPVGIMSTIWRKPEQYVQPYWFGDSARKTTCLWLHNLPPLKPTNLVDEGEFHVTKSGRKLPKWYNLPPSPDRGKIRSKTFQGMAEAMATQWGGRL
jgi:hypothetical protein